MSVQLLLLQHTSKAEGQLTFITQKDCNNCRENPEVPMLLETVLSAPFVSSRSHGGNLAGEVACLSETMISEVMKRRRVIAVVMLLG